jgi:putative peptidoglycan lipid II flippase
LSTQLVVWALLWYAFGLVGHSVVEIMVRAFYAMHDTKTPVLIGIAAMTLNILLSIAFLDLFTRWGWMPHGGLALANSLATMLEMIVLVYLMHGRLQGLEGRQILVAFVKAAIAVFIMALVLVAWTNQVINQPTWLLVVGGVALGAGVYGILVLILGVKEARNLMRSVGQKVRQKLSS